MDSRIEKLLNRQIELIDRLQDRTDEILDWRTSPENAEAVLEYFEALESAVESLEGLSEFYQESKSWELEDKDRKSDRDYREDNRLSDRSYDDKDDYESRRR